MNVPVASWETVPEEVVVSPQLIVAEYSLVVAIRFGSVKAPMGAVNGLPSISVSVAGEIGADHRRCGGDGERGYRCG